MAIDLRTEEQKVRRKRAQRVCELYKQLIADDAGSNTQIWNYIAQEMGKEFEMPLSSVGVRQILVRHGLYTQTRRRRTLERARA